MDVWPTTADELMAVQSQLAAMSPPPWQLVTPLRVGAVWVCFPRGASGPGSAGDPAWAAAVVMHGRRVVDQVTVTGVAGAAYAPGLLALRVGPLMGAAVAALDVEPDVLLVDATGLDHPRRSGLALHLGVVLDVPTVGITHRPLLASGAWPADEVNARSPLLLDGETVGYWLRTRVGRRPVVVHAGWRTDPDTAVDVVVACKGKARTPAPLRQARRLARRSRAAT